MVQKNIISFIRKIPWLKNLTKESVRRIIHIFIVPIYINYHFIKMKWRKFIIQKKNPGRKVVAISLVEHLGDIVASEPVSRNVREREPEAFIIWFVRQPYKELIENNPFIDKTFVVYCLTDWIYLSRKNLFDEVIDLHLQHRVCPYCKIPLSKDKGNKEISYENYYNFGNLLSVFCQVAGLPVLNDQPKIYIPSTVIRKIDAANLDHKYIVIHCLSNIGEKDWINSKWEALIKQITTDWQISVIEVGIVSAIKNNSLKKYMNFCGKLSILETAEVIRRAQLFIGVDSGPAQIANAVGIVGVILIGHFLNFKYYLPYSGNFAVDSTSEIIYEDGPVAGIDVNRVYQSVERSLLRCGMRRNTN